MAEIPDEDTREAERTRLLAVCSKCRLGEDLPGDGSVSLDAIIDGTAEAILDVAPGVATFCTFDPGEIDGDVPEPAGATNLAPEADDTLRRLFATVVGLAPLEFVVLLHVARRSRKTVAEAVRDFAAEVRAYRRSALKSTFHEKWKSLVRRIPELAAIRPATSERHGA